MEVFIMFDVTAIGEILIDFLPINSSENGNFSFECNPGGAPANVLACLSKYGGKTSFIGKVGDDMFGEYLKEILIKNNIDEKGLSISKTVKTTLAFVKLDKRGDRSFSFYRDPGADTQLKDKDLDYDLISDSKIFHFGSLSLSNEPSYSTTLKALDFAKKKNKIISYDPNYRKPLWKSEKEAIEKIKIGLDYADILKISEEEVELLTGSSDLKEGINQIKENYKINLVIATMGKHGCMYRYKNYFEKFDTIDANEIDTTGAGDIFLGSVLYYLIYNLNLNIDNLDKDEIKKMLMFANSASAKSTEKKGAIPSIPNLNEVYDNLKNK
jgi:fructokinase